MGFPENFFIHSTIEILEYLLIVRESNVLSFFSGMDPPIGKEIPYHVVDNFHIPSDSCYIFLQGITPFRDS